MNKILTIFTLALLTALPLVAGASCAGSHPQKITQKADDYALLSATYEVVAQQVEEIAKKDKDLMRLDIGSHSSQFRSVIIEWIKDNGLVLGSPESLNHPYRGYTWLEYQVVKNLPKQGYMFFTHGHISVRDKMEGLFDWQLIDEDSVVCGYPCKKAITSFRGRIWTVWYSPLLPYSDGPWKFCGLPGLVLKADEAERKLSFKCKKVEKDTKYGIFLVKKNASPMLRMESDVLDTYRLERALELMKLEKYDPTAFVEEIHGGMSAPDIKSARTLQVTKNGKQMETLHHTAILYEKTAK
jgi:GLPGLI family protein